MKIDEEIVFKVLDFQTHEDYSEDFIRELIEMMKKEQAKQN